MSRHPGRTDRVQVVADLAELVHRRPDVAEIGCALVVTLAVADA